MAPRQGAEGISGSCCQASSRAGQLLSPFHWGFLLPGCRGSLCALSHCPHGEHVASTGVVSAPALFSPPVYSQEWFSVSFLCFSGFVELNHTLTPCYPPSANSTSGPLRLLQKPRGERERWPHQGHFLLDVLWNSERICNRPVTPPGTFSLCTHIHNSFQNPAWIMTASVSGPQKKQKLLLEQWGESKKTISDLLTVTNPDELLYGVWMWKVQRDRNF